MKRLLFLALIFLPAAAQSQEVYQVSASAGQVTRLTKAVTIANRQTCASMALGPTCIQADICTAKGLGACTPVQARAAGVRIYLNTLAGREEFITFGLLIPAFQQLMSTAITTDQQDWCANFKTSAPAAQQASCTGQGLPSNCEICP